jgi:hypothetical protein
MAPLPIKRVKFDMKSMIHDGYVSGGSLFYGIDGPPEKGSKQFSVLVDKNFDITKFSGPVRFILRQSSAKILFEFERIHNRDSEINGIYKR